MNSDIIKADIDRIMKRLDIAENEKREALRQMEAVERERAECARQKAECERRLSDLEYRIGNGRHRLGDIEREIDITRHSLDARLADYDSELRREGRLAGGPGGLAATDKGEPS